MAYNFSNPYLNYGMYQQPMYQQMQQQMQQQVQQPQAPQPTSTNTQYDKPIQDVRFVESGKDAEDYILLPNTRVMLIDRKNSMFYIKSTDSLGTPTMETYKYSKLADKSNISTAPEIDTKDFVKVQDLKGYITKEDLGEFITKDDLKNLTTKVERLQEQVISGMLRGGANRNEQ